MVVLTSFLNDLADLLVDFVYDVTPVNMTVPVGLGAIGSTFVAALVYMSIASVAFVVMRRLVRLLTGGDF